MSLLQVARVQYYFPENFRCSLAHYESDITFLIPNILVFLFPTKNSLASTLFPGFSPPGNEVGLAWGVKCEKLNFRKSYREFIK